METLQFDDLFYRAITGSYVQGRRFQPRDWLEDELLAQLDEPGCRFLLLSGEPGSGKSAFIAQLASRHPNWPVFYIRRDQRTALGESGARAFLLRTGLQLRQVYPELFEVDNIRLSVEQRIGTVANRGEAVGAEIEKFLASPFYQPEVEIVQEVERDEGRVTGVKIGVVVSNPWLLEVDDLQNLALFDPARLLAQKRPGERITVLVDALDELHYHPVESTLLHWLTHCSPPENLRFVVSSRPPERALVTFMEKQRPALRVLAIEAGDPRVQDDLLRYAGGLADGEGMPAALQQAQLSRQEFVDEAVKKADGNLGYLDALGRVLDQTLALPGGAAELPEFLALRRLPASMQELYAFFLHRVKNGPGSKDVKVRDPISGRSGLVEAWAEVFSPLLGLLAVAAEPLTLDQLWKLTGTLADRAYVEQAAGWLGEFMDRPDGRYRLYHSTLAEFLTAPGTQADPESAGLYHDPLQTHRQVAEALAWQLESVWEPAPASPAEEGRRAYARRHYLSHLYQGQDWEALFAVLDEGQYGKGKLRSDPSTYLYALDLDLARKAAARPDPAQGAGMQAALALLPRLWQYGLLRLSLASDAGLYVPDTFGALALTGQEEEALGLARLVAAPHRQAQALGQIARSLAARPEAVSRAAPVLLQAFSAARRTGDPDRLEAVLGYLLEAARSLLEAGRGPGGEGLSSAVGNTVGSALPSALPEIFAALRELAQGLPAGARQAAALQQVAGWAGEAGLEPEAEALLEEMERQAAEAGAQADWVRLQAVAAWAQAGRFERAFALVERLERGWSALRAYCSLAAALKRAGRAAEADSALKVAHSILTSASEAGYAPQALVIVAQARVEMGEAEEARALLSEGFGRLRARGLEAADLELLSAYGQGLKEAGEQALAQDALAALLEGAQRVFTANRPQPGHGYGLSLEGTRAAAALAELDEPEMALQAAARAQPHERYNILQAAVEALARRGGWDRALEVVESIRAARRESPFSVSFSRSGPGASLDAADLALCTLVAALAERQEWARAREIAEEAAGIEAFALALSAIALQQARAGSPDRAAGTLAALKQAAARMRSQYGRDRALYSVIELHLKARAWERARDTARRLASPDERRRALRLVAAARMEAGDFAAAEALLPELEDPAAWGSAALELAEKLRLAGEGAQAARALEQARGCAVQLTGDPLSQAELLRALALGQAALGDLPGAEAALFEALEAMNRVESFPYRPTPWADLAGEFARAGRRDYGLNLARQLADFDPFDGGIAYLNLARFAAETGEPEAALDLLAVVRELVPRVSFPPIQGDLCARLAEAYTRLGQVETALSPEICTPTGQYDLRNRVAARLAEAGRTGEAEGLLEKLDDRSRASLALRALVGAYLDGGEVEKALETARVFAEPAERAEVFSQVAACLDGLGQPARAGECFSLALEEAREVYAPGRALIPILERMLAAGRGPEAVKAVQTAWLEASGRDELLGLLPAAVPLAALQAQLGEEIEAAFDWVQEFLEGV